MKHPNNTKFTGINVVSLHKRLSKQSSDIVVNILCCAGFKLSDNGNRLTFDVQHNMQQLTNVDNIFQHHHMNNTSALSTSTAAACTAVTGMASSQLSVRADPCTQWHLYCEFSCFLMICLSSERGTQQYNLNMDDDELAAWKQIAMSLGFDCDALMALPIAMRLESIPATSRPNAVTVLSHSKSARDSLIRRFYARIDQSVWNEVPCAVQQRFIQHACGRRHIYKTTVSVSIRQYCLYTYAFRFIIECLLLPLFDASMATSTT